VTAAVCALALHAWDERIALGGWEWAMVALAHAIILTIALVRYGLLERRRGR
jgi:hypothetical protein